MKIGIFYGPIGGSTEKVANLIAKEFGTENTELILVKKSSIEELAKFDKVIFGISTIGKETWDAHHPNTDWDYFFSTILEADFSNKTAALFGLGNSTLYSFHFVDALGKLGQKLINKNVNIVGQCSTNGYTYDESEAVIEGKFIGLPIDEDSEEHLTSERVKNWVNEIKPHFS